jgi:hypothetical protein
MVEERRRNTPKTAKEKKKHSAIPVRMFSIVNQQE